MDWKKIHREFHAFAAKLGWEVEADDTHFFYGKSSTYYLTEPNQAYYKLKHTKPIRDYGSKLRVYSRFNGDLSIKAKPRFFGKPKISANVDLTPDLHQNLISLCQQVGGFCWTAQPHHKSWPFELANERTLRFECKRVDLAVSQLSIIREIHLALKRQYDGST